MKKLTNSRGFFLFVQKFLSHSHILQYRKKEKVGERMKPSIDSEQVGAAINAVGTVLSAIATTPSKSIPDAIQDDIEFIGSILEALGTAIGSNEDATALVKTGELIDVIGSLEVAASAQTDNKQLQRLLYKKGNLLQALGEAATLPYGRQLAKSEVIATVGSVLEIIGNSIQALADDKTELGIIWNAIGGWVQAVGAVITVVAFEI